MIVLDGFKLVKFSENNTSNMPDKQGKTLVSEQLTGAVELESMCNHPALQHGWPNLGAGFVVNYDRAVDGANWGGVKVKGDIEVLSG